MLLVGCEVPAWLALEAAQCLPLPSDVHLHCGGKAGMRPPHGARRIKQDDTGSQASLRDVTLSHRLCLQSHGKIL